MPERIIVVGTGIIGASISYHLARAGAQVVMVEAGEAGGLATRASWAWINASWSNPHFYFRFRVRSMAEWRRLEREVVGLHVNWCGGLLWDLPPDQLEAYAKEHTSWGYGIRRVDRREVQRIEPNLEQAPDFALRVAEEGVVEPLGAAQALVNAAQSLGAEVRTHTHVKRLLTSGGAVTGVETESGELGADMVVLAAGAGAPPLAASAGIRVPLTTPAGLLIHSKPVDRLLNGLVMAPELHVRQTADGRLVAGADFGGANPGIRPEETARELFVKLQALIKGGERLKYDSHTIGYRPTPTDEYPIIGPTPGMGGLYIAVMHSGITNAAAVGLFASREILENQRDELLSPFGIERFAGR